jgi:hypothetical protein
MRRSRDSALAKTDEQLLTGKAAGDFEKTVAEADALWADRMDQSNVEAALVKWEEAAGIATQNLSEDERRDALFNIHVSLTRGYYFLADTHLRLSGDVEEDDALKEKMKNTFNKGVTASEKAVAIYSPEFSKAIRNDTAFPEAIKLLDKGAIPALYWYSTNLGKWALIEGLATILSHKDNIKAIMDKIESENPEFYHGGAFRYFGAYWSKLPSFAGRDMDKSKAYFQKSIERAPNYLATYVLYAELYATGVEDKDDFQKKIDFVLKFNLDSAPDVRAENEFEQRKARVLLGKMDDLF